MVALVAAWPAWLSSFAWLPRGGRVALCGSLRGLVKRMQLGREAQREGL